MNVDDSIIKVLHKFLPDDKKERMVNRALRTLVAQYEIEALREEVESTSKQQAEQFQSEVQKIRAKYGV